MNESVRTITHAFEHSRVTGIGDDLLLRKKQPLRNLTLLTDNRHNLMPRPHEFICSPTANEATSSCHHNSPYGLATEPSSRRKSAQESNVRGLGWVYRAPARSSYSTPSPGAWLTR